MRFEVADRASRLVQLIIAGVVLVAIGAVGAWLQRDAPGRSAQPRTEFTASNPPAGLPIALTTGQHLHWSRCTSPPTARRSYDCAVMKAPLDYRKPDGRTIDVALIRRKAAGPNPGASARPFSTSAVPACPV
ncbi:hypothetical protein RKD37_007663 [Streptomyces ambofaciens]